MNLLIGLVVAAALLAVFLRHLRMEREALRRSFATQVFDTPEGKVEGRALQVVKTATLGGTTPNGVEDFVTMTRDEFWYCVGPGPTYFLAIPTIGTSFGQVDFVRWVVRPLSKERMRAALAGDRRATKLAFGEAIDA